MRTALIKLLYRQVIDASSTGSFERNVFNVTYDEFKLKSQAYNPAGDLTTFTQLKAHDGRANSLHYKISFAAGNLIAALDNKIPALKDNINSGVPFDVAKFELIESDLTNKDAHKLAINYMTETLTLFEIIGDYMVLAVGEFDEDKTAETFILKMQPNLSIMEFYIQSKPLTKAFVPVHINNN
ncbi:MAG TPA: hypothetical protein VL490_08275 [Mucilaginibacter sp.]|nr:hypothetical protein [Mucilaginibacter sp.]